MNFRRFARRSLLIAVIAAFITVGVVRAVPSRHVTVDVFDVGQGDAVLISAGRTQMLIDGGPDRSILAKLGRRMPLFDRTIEYVVLTHPHADHFVGLSAVFERYDVGHVLHSGAVNDTPEFTEFLRKISASRTTVTVDDRIVFDERASATVLAPHPGPSPEDVNEASVVIRLDALGRSALMMGDAGGPVEEALLASGDAKPVDILKVGHHGSRTASTAAFLAAIAPHDAIISVGRNRYGHPSAAALRRLETAGARIWRTDERGDIRIMFMDDGYRIVPSRGTP